MAKRITTIAIDNMKAGRTRREVPAGNGLYVVVEASGRKGFAVRYRFAGRTRRLVLHNGVTLAQARQLAADAMFEVAQGRDPAVAKQQAKGKAAAADADTLRAIGDEYLRREGHKLRTLPQREDTLRRLVYPRLGDRQVASIRRSEINRLLDKIEDDNGPVMADRTLMVLRRIFGWHATRSDTFNSPIVRGMARTKPSERARSRILSDTELQQVWAAAGATPGPFGPLVKFLLLTAARRCEVSGLRWSEISDDGWLLPEARNKTKVELLRPLSSAARRLLADLPRFEGCDFVFTWDGRRPITGFSKPKRELDALCGVRGWCLHDLRRSSRSLLSRAGVNADIAERCLGHVIPGVRGTYDRHQYQAEMLHAFAALAARISQIVNPPDGANVVQLRA
jgi:integrase